MDLRLDDGGDLYVSGGDVALTSGVEATIQRLTCKFRMFKGEWFLNPAEGMPYYDEIFVKSPSLSAVTSFFRRVVLEDPDVAELVSFRAAVDSTTRTLSISFEARSLGGNPIVFEDFIL